jgi:nicotinamide-nucleotide amidase
MLTDVLLPRVRDRLARTGTEETLPVVRARTVRTTGIAESALADHLAEFKRAVHDVPLAYLPGVEGVDLRLTVSGVPSDVADGMLDRAERVLLERVGDWIYGHDDEDLAAVVLRALKAHSHTIAVAESCTGGLLGARLTAIPGSSHSVVGGVIAYDNRVKESLLGVSASLLDAHGAVSEAVARAMAAGVRARLGADVGVGITGVAGPSGGSDEKPVGTVWIAIDSVTGSQAVKPVFPGDRADIRARAAQMALDLVRRSYRVP